MTTPDTNPGAATTGGSSRLTDVAQASGSNEAQRDYEARLKNWARKMRLWGAEFVQWGARVQADIIRLEEKTGIARGDPGSPPPPPPPPEE